MKNNKNFNLVGFLITTFTIFVVAYGFYYLSRCNSKYEKVTAIVVSSIDNKFLGDTVSLSIEKYSYSLGDTILAQWDDNSSHWYIPKKFFNKDITYVMDNWYDDEIDREFCVAKLSIVH